MVTAKVAPPIVCSMSTIDLSAPAQKPYGGHGGVKRLSLIQEEDSNVAYKVRNGAFNSVHLYLYSCTYIILILYTCLLPKCMASQGVRFVLMGDQGQKQ